MTKMPRRILPLNEWPDIDATVWRQTFENVDRFSRASSNSRLAPRTRLWLKIDYENWLAFLSATHPKALSQRPDKRFREAFLEEYLSWLRKSCRESTIGMRLRNITYILRRLYPNKEWDCLARAAHQILSQATPRDKPLISSNDLIAVGIRLMESARQNSAASALPSKTDCAKFRDGLMIAVFAAFIPRRRTMSSLTIDKHVFRSGNRWVIDIPPEDMKSRRPHQLAAAEFISSWVDEYLTRFRPRILGAESHNGFWASRQSRPMTEIGIYQVVTRRTRAELGISVHPHFFRSAAVAFLSRESLKGLKTAQELAGHSSPKTTEKYYRRALTESAGRAYTKAINQQRKAARTFLKAEAARTCRLTSRGQKNNKFEGLF